MYRRSSDAAVAMDESFSTLCACLHFAQGCLCPVRMYKVIAVFLTRIIQK